MAMPPCRLRWHARCVWLTAEPDELMRRLAADGRTATLRPALTGLSPLDEIEQVVAARAPLYRELAATVRDTSGRSAEQVAGEIVRW